MVVKQLRMKKKTLKSLSPNNKEYWRILKHLNKIIYHPYTLVGR